ncbi:MAG: BON domain-containing protein [Terriglobales bacterium]
MKRVLLVMLVLVAALAILAGCQKARTDAQIAADVQGKINSDPAVASRQYTVSANNGVVTLNGFVGSEAERTAAANDAAQVEGVKTVVNNLQPAQPTTAEAQPEEPEQEAVAAPRTRETRYEARPRQRKSSGFTQGTRRATSYTPPPEPAPAARVETYTPSSNVAQAPPPPPKPVELTIPEGTALSVRLIDPIDSERNQTGDHFRATLDAPITVGDAIAIPAGADVYGRVTNAKNAAHFSGSSELALELTRINVNGKSYELHTDQFSRRGKARGKNTAAKVGGGAALGAIIGGIAGGGKGAAIGATIGAGAGGTAQAVTRGEQIRLTSEQILSFHLESPLTVVASSRLDRNRERQTLNYSDQN